MPTFNSSLRDEKTVIKEIVNEVHFSDNQSHNILENTRVLINKIREDKSFSIEDFMQQFSLSTSEGVAIMCLAEGLLRIPDNYITLDFIVDKLHHKEWWSYVNESKSLKASFASYGLSIAAAFAGLHDKDNIFSNLISRLGRTIFIQALKQSIRFLGKEFVFGEDVESALTHCKQYEKYRFSFDLLGESSRTLEQAEIYFDQYMSAIDKIARLNSFENDDIYSRPNLSVKLTALYPKFEWIKKEDIEKLLLPKLIKLVRKIKDNNLTITFDAEEASRLDIYTYTIDKILKHNDLKDFAGIGFVVQAYQTRALNLLDYIIRIAQELQHKIPVRLVKGAYWDLEIKKAQEYGLNFYPVFTNKHYTDVSYIACAKKMLENSEWIFPQFATHNALTASSIIEIADNKPFELQKLHGMGKILHQELVKSHNVRIYAPVGKMNDLLAYLMRRMLENGANGCFVNKVKNDNIETDSLVYDLYHVASEELKYPSTLPLPQNIFETRQLPITHDLGYMQDYNLIKDYVSNYYNNSYIIGSIINGKTLNSGDKVREVCCPANTVDKIGSAYSCEAEDIKLAITYANEEFADWSKIEISKRREILNKIADLYEYNKYHLYALLNKEAGKTINDAMAEVTEAIDFCRYYGNLAEEVFKPIILPSPTGESNILTLHPRGVFLCISPWNFPLAIFTGQIVAALVCGNSVIAKPAEQTCIIAYEAVKLMHQAGIPKNVLQLVLAKGSEISNNAVGDERVIGVAFTGSTETAKKINLTLASRDGGGIVPFIAETGGQNAMIVDSSALLEQVSDDVINSAFGSSGQRCSALRVLYIQEEIYDSLIDMLSGALSLLKIGDTRDFTTDIGPVIDINARRELVKHIDDMQKQGFKIIAKHPETDKENAGHFVYPHIIAINSIKDLLQENFGPILHVIKYKSSKLDEIIEEINSCGYGLTFGVHSRINSKIDYIASKIKAGNIYANRSMIGAKVGSQPFGGENKSGTGFKAGGPHYLFKFVTERTVTINLTAIGGNVELLSK